MSGNNSLAAPARLRSLRWIDCLAPGLLQWAARTAPEDLRERMAEEWLADFAQQNGRLAQLRFILGCYWAATVIRLETPLAAPVPLASSPAVALRVTNRRYPGRSVSTRPRACAANNTVMSEMNITPLIDVMLVLLVTLIISLPTMTHAVKLDLPRGMTSLQKSLPVVDLDIDSDGTIAWNGTVLTGLQQLESYLQAEAQRDPQAEIHLRPERRAKYDVVAKVLAAAQRNRMERMAFVNTSEFAN